jgi:lysophospholipase L1-like esterase
LKCAESVYITRVSGTDLVVFGDSVVWGQGLRDEHKSAALVATALNGAFPGIQPVNLAHSGAVIGRAGTCALTRFPGEMPESCPSILQQIGMYSGDPNTAPLVLLNGGINDVDIRTILSPFTTASDLSSDIQQYCYKDMGYLLTQVKARFSNANTRIIVTSYFPIISSLSDFNLVPPLMEFLGAPMPQFLSPVSLDFTNPIMSKIVSLCLQFWHESSEALGNCVKAVNEGTGPRCFFADVPFSERNSVFAPDAWLFGVGPAPDFAAQDEVIATRVPQCDVTFRDDFPGREQCYRASAGHPTVTGAQQFARAILASIGQ